MSDRTRHRLAALALLAALLFGYPAMAVIEELGRCCVRGAVPLYIFFVWVAVILVAWGLLHREGTDR